jgi:cytochrome c oxidase subunit 2
MLTTFLANSSPSFWMPERASTVAPSVDHVFTFIYWLCVFFFVLVTALLVAFVIKYRHRRGEQPHEPAAGHSTALELTWTIIPTVLVLVIFYFGFRGFLNMSVEPPNPYEIGVTGSMWQWSFTYPNGYSDTELHLPPKTPVRFVLSSNDVIHSLYVPAFRVKQDVVPGRYNRMWVEATEPGKYDLYCAEYCGTNHSAMLSYAVVHESRDEFDKWLVDAADWTKRMSPLDAGKKFYETRGCKTCHTIDGTPLTGPTWKDLFGSQVPTSAGSVNADENYVRESILYPGAKIHQGFPNTMPSFLGQFSDRDIDAIIAFMKSISKNYQGDLGPLKQVTPATGPSKPAK